MKNEVKLVFFVFLAAECRTNIIETVDFEWLVDRTRWFLLQVVYESSQVDASGWRNSSLRVLHVIWQNTKLNNSDGPSLYFLHLKIFGSFSALRKYVSSSTNTKLKILRHKIEKTKQYQNESKTSHVTLRSKKDAEDVTFFSRLGRFRIFRTIKWSTNWTKLGKN